MFSLDQRAFSYEFTPVPVAMFTKNGMQIGKSKYTLERSFQAEVSRKNARDADVTVIDGLDLL